MSIFTARKVTHDRVYEEAMRLAFPTNGRYTNDDAQRFTLGLSRILRSTYNPDGAGDGMASLLRSSTDTTNPSRISGLQSTHTITATAILLQAAADAKAANEATPKPDLAVEPDFATRAEAQDESDRINEATQAVIGAKEAIAKAITTKAGTRITDAILRTTDGQDHKSIDEFELHELVSALMQGAERTAISEVREGTSPPTSRPSEPTSTSSWPMESSFQMASSPPSSWPRPTEPPTARAESRSTGP
jgi:hypothetical protein